MKTEDTFDINNTLKVLDEIKKAEVNSELKAKILQRIELEAKNEPSKVWNLQIRIQAAAAILILLLNATVLFYTLKSTSAEEEQITDLSSFAKAYSLSTDNSLQFN